MRSEYQDKIDRLSNEMDELYERRSEMWQHLSGLPSGDKAAVFEDLTQINEEIDRLDREISVLYEKIDGDDGTW